MEIGGYRELDLRTGFEKYASEHTARLNAGRCGIYHAARCLGCSKVLLPYYQCETVRNFLLKKGLKVSYFHIGEDMLPLVENDDEETAIVIVNYFGLISGDILERFVQKNNNVIIDNTQGFYQPNFQGAYSVYSPRKFVGVADGCYVVGENAAKFIDEYEQDYSASTASFLLARIESGGNANYALYQENEERLAFSDVLRMSKLTQALLDNVDYSYVARKRQDNYDYAASIFDRINCLSRSVLRRSSGQIPMVYPLMVRQKELRHVLKANQIYVGQWWEYLLKDPQASDWEKECACYLLPIQIDQRYGAREIDYTADIIFRTLDSIQNVKNRGLENV